MKISASWLREWVPHRLEPEAVAERLTMLGLEVETIERVAPPIAGVVVGEVIGVRRHPKADKLTLCSVNVGGTEPLQIVCGAPNVRSAGRYPTALEGATLPDGISIRGTRLRGELSQGMLCSAAELGLAPDAGGLLELPGSPVPGADVVNLLDLDDRVLDINVTPNRGDCFSLRGIGREIAAALSLPFVDRQFPPVSPRSAAHFPVRLESPADCPRFVARVIQKLNPESRTPLWLCERLRRSGVRPIHPVVDVTNFVMLELGQPMHAYDLSRIQREIVVRRGRSGEDLELLDGRRIALDPGMLVIADGGGPVGLAGIMGGSSSGVLPGTTAVLLESAFFAPAAIAGRARALGLHTDASLRFERGLDPLIQGAAMERATALICEIAGGEPGVLVDHNAASDLPVDQPVTLRRERLAAVLGVEIPADSVAAILSRLGMSATARTSGWSVTPPSWRFDIEREEDLIEEVARLNGYEQIPETPGACQLHLHRDSEGEVPLARARSLLVDRGYQEAITYSFVEAEADRLFSGDDSALALSNPISADLAVMRQTLWPGLVRAAQWNLDRQQARVRLFEIGNSFRGAAGALREEASIAALITGSRWPEQWSGASQNADFFDMKADLEALLSLTGDLAGFEFRSGKHPALHPSRAAQVLRNGDAIGWLGELNPRLAGRFGLRDAMILFEVLAGRALKAPVPSYRGISKFPAVRRDLALVVPDGIPVADLIQTARDAVSGVLREVAVFDIYSGGQIGSGQKSVAMGLILQDTSRTLTDTDADQYTAAVVNALKKRFNARIRD